MPSNTRHLINAQRQEIDQLFKNYQQEQHRKLEQRALDLELEIERERNREYRANIWLMVTSLAMVLFWVVMWKNDAI